MPKRRKSDDIIVGLDIGSSEIRVAVAEVGDDGLPQIIGMGSSPSAGIRVGVVVSLDETTQSIRKAVDEAKRFCGVEITDVNLGVGGNEISCFTNKGMVSLGREPREVNSQDIQRAQEAAETIPLPADKRIIHILPREYTIDGQVGIVNPLGMTGVRLEVELEIITGTSSIIQNVISATQKAGLNVESTVLEPLAASYSVLTKAERENGAVVIDIGGGTTDLAVFSKGTLRHAAIIPIGGEHITRDLARILNIGLASAEELKRRFGIASSDFLDDDEFLDVPLASNRLMRKISRVEVAQIISERLDEIFEDFIMRELEEILEDTPLPGGVVLTGGCALIPHIDELASEKLKMQVRIGTPQGDGMSGLVDVLSQPAYATAAGITRFAIESRAITQKVINSTKKKSSFFQNLKDFFNDFF